MEKQIINTTNAPAAIGPYSQAVEAGQFLFISGQIPLHPVTGEVVAGDIVQQTHQVMKNLTAIAEAGGSALSRIAKTTVYLTDLADFAAFNKVYQEYFPQNPPARATVQVAGLPKGVKIEIEAVAVK